MPVPFTGPYPMLLVNLRRGPAAVHDLGARHLRWSAVCSIELPAFPAVVAQIEHRLKALRLD